MLKAIFHLLLDFFYPTYCCACGQFGDYLCKACYQRIHFLSVSVHLKLEKVFLDEVWAVCAHRRPIISLIYQLKYRSVKEIGSYLGKFIYYSFAVPPADFITAVPLHPHKQFMRGFNQAEIMAKQLAKELQIPYGNLLRRTKDTPAQAFGMNKQKRLKNTKNLYALNERAWKKLSASPLPKTILIVDDVITTGATLNHCAAILKQAGVPKVIGLAITHRF